MGEPASGQLLDPHTSQVCVEVLVSLVPLVVVAVSSGHHVVVREAAERCGSVVGKGGQV